MARLVIASTLVFTAAMIFGTAESCGSCAPGWTRYGCGCYRFYNNPRLSWTNAEAYCQNGGEVTAHLASIGSIDLSYFLVEYWKSILAPNAWNDVWIGNNDRSHEGQWVWGDGSTSSFTNWSPGRPNQAGNEDCGEMWNQQAGQGKWNDDDCSRVQAFVCEYKPE